MLVMVDTLLTAIDLDPNLQLKLNAFEKHGQLSNYDLKHLRKFVDCLQPLKTATDVFQKDAETVGLVIPFYLQTLRDAKENQSKGFYCTELSRKLAENWETRLKDVLTDNMFLLGNSLNLSLLFVNSFTIVFIPLIFSSLQRITLITGIFYFHRFAS